MSKVSIVTPVYNAAKYLRPLYDNLCEQNYTDWQWVVVDDGSTDGSGRIVDDIQSVDSRVKVFHQDNSGSAKLPRDRAVYESTGEFIIPIDADDSINMEYIDTLVKRQNETDADIVYPVMNFIKDGKLWLTLPLEKIDTTKVYTGREALLFTLPKFEIGCNGGIYKRKIWVNSSYPSFDGKTIFMNSDELDERLYLLEAEKVAFCNAQYIYLIHDESITNKVKLNRFDVLDTSIELRDIIGSRCGTDNEAYRAAQLKIFYDFRNKMRLYMEHYDDFESDRDIILKKLRTSFGQLRDVKISLRERIQYLGMHSFYLTLLMTSIKYRGLKGLLL